MKSATMVAQEGTVERIVDIMSTILPEPGRQRHVARRGDARGAARGAQGRVVEALLEDLRRGEGES
ncbi:hypothetical protein WME75_16830 [Sorangium sp. So ce1014]|uniref:hypothetical protein n=1 Tax=Sorangium sp. So ce1014 TaxID=3133326 RepID=UPI003F620A04